MGSHLSRCDRRPQVSAPFVSIVIPTRNGMATLPPLLDALRQQCFEPPVEIVAVDSASTDGTADLLRQRADRVVSIRADEFNHGLTRNLAVEHTRGEFVVLMVQDAMPTSDRWLTHLVAPLVGDSRVAGSFARQRARPDASAITSYYLDRAIAGRDDSRTIAIDRATLAALAPLDRLAACTFDNVCSCIRRSVWCEHRFRPTTIAEDIEWAIEVLLAGYRLAYAPEAVVLHSHDRSARYEFARTYLLHRRLFELLEVRTIPTLPLLARAVTSSLALHWRCERSRPLSARAFARLGQALSLAIAWPLGQYLGALSAVKGWEPPQWRTV
jgi:glycosyltransferase involved in cell wall biosynthesis